MKKTKFTLYAIQCYMKRANNQKEQLGAICGLFRDKEKAKDCCQFLNENSDSGLVYEIHLVITDMN